MQSFEIIAFAGAFKENAGGCSLLYCHVGRRERAAPTALIVESRNSSKELPLLPPRPLSIPCVCMPACPPRLSQSFFVRTLSVLQLYFTLFCDDNKASFKRWREKLSERRAHKLLQMCNLFISLGAHTLFSFLSDCMCSDWGFTARMCVKELLGRDFHLEPRDARYQPQRNNWLP